MGSGLKSLEQQVAQERTVQGGSRFYRPELDVLRFFAFLCVFLHHTLSLQGASGVAGDVARAFQFAMSYAVSLFFLLSAFLITTLLEMELDRSDTVDVAAFYVRRVLRIWPLYYWAMGVSILAGLFFATWKTYLNQNLCYLFFVGNWYGVLHGWPHNTYGVLWSVNIEEQFYLVCPLIVLWMRRRGMLGTALASVAISYAVLLGYGLRQNFDDTSLRLNTLVQLQFFGAGMLLAVVMRGRQVRMPGWMRAGLVLTGVGVWTAGAYGFDSRCSTAVMRAGSPAALQVLTLAGCLAIFFGFFGMGLWRKKNPFVYLGKISYGLYVYHVPIVMAVIFPYGRLAAGSRLLGSVPMKAGVRVAALGLTIGLAAMSYEWLEKPFLKLKERFTVVRSRMA